MFSMSLPYSKLMTFMLLTITSLFHPPSWVLQWANTHLASVFCHFLHDPLKSQSSVNIQFYLERSQEISKDTFQNTLFRNTMTSPTDDDEMWHPYSAILDDVFFHACSDHPCVEMGSPLEIFNYLWRRFRATNITLLTHKNRHACITHTYCTRMLTDV